MTKNKQYFSKQNENSYFLTKFRTSSQNRLWLEWKASWQEHNTIWVIVETLLLTVRTYGQSGSRPNDQSLCIRDCGREFKIFKFTFSCWNFWISPIPAREMRHTTICNDRRINRFTSFRSPTRPGHHNKKPTKRSTTLPKPPYYKNYHTIPFGSRKKELKRVPALSPFSLPDKRPRR